MTGRVRRVLALVFAVAVAATILTPLSLPATVAHASWNDEASQLRAAQRMAALGLIIGADESELTHTMTRTDAIVLLVRALGREGDARFLKGTPSFSDVATDDEASGYIAVAKSLVEGAGSGLSLADADGNFRPEDDLRTQDALLFLMAFLGVARDASQSPPDDLLAGALQAGLVNAEMEASLRADIEADRTAAQGQFFALADYVFYHFPITDGKTVYTKYVDSDPPSLDIKDPEPTVTVSVVTIEGTVSGAEQVTVNGIGTPIADDGTIAAVVPLTLGDNHIAVVATDLAGNKTERVITVRLAGVQFGQTATAAITLLDDQGNAIPNVTVTVSSTGTTDADAELTTDGNGEVTWSFTAAKPVGTGYEVTASFAGNDSHAPASAAIPFEIVPREIVLDLPTSLSGAIGQPLELSATVLTLDTRAPVSGLPITFTFQGLSATSEPSDNEGDARIALTPTQAGQQFPYTATYTPGDGSNYAAATSQGDVTVERQLVRATANDVTIAYGSDATLTASFEKKVGATWLPLDAGTAVTLTAPSLGLNGQPVSVGEGGVASYVVTAPELGTYTFAFSLSGHSVFADAATDGQTLTVSQRATQLQSDLEDDPDVTYGEEFDVTITLADDGGPLADQEVFYTLEPDEDRGELAAVRQALQALASAATVGGNGRTDSDGHITFRIRPPQAGKFKLTIGFAGNDNNLPQSVVHSMLVKKQPTTLTATGATVFVNRQATVTALLAGTLSGPLDGMTLTFAEPMLGAYTPTTAAGSSTVTVTPTAPGLFTFVIRFAGDANFLPSEATALVTVNRPTPPPPPGSGTDGDETINPAEPDAGPGDSERDAGPSDLGARDDNVTTDPDTPETSVDPSPPATGPSAPNLPFTGGTYVWYLITGAALTAGGVVGLRVWRRRHAG